MKTPLLDPIRRAIDYLLVRQRTDGAWLDYALPVGASDQWVTAYVAAALVRVPAELRPPALGPTLERAAQWLICQRSYTRGWGYNGTTGADADSTAYAIDFLRLQGRRVAFEDMDFLLEHWHPAGGARTYLRTDGWGRDHPDVTCPVFRALPAAEQRERLPALLAYLRSMRDEFGCWPAYWWRTSYYSTYLCLELLYELGIPEAQLLPPPRPATHTMTTAFELGFALGALALRADAQAWGPHLEALLRLQQKDGGFVGGANLGVTDPDCHEPWKTPRRRYYVDRQGLLTTASVLRALLRISWLGADRSAADG